MVVLQYTFTRPNTSVNFYSASEDANVVSALRTAQQNKDITSLSSSISPNGLVMTTSISFVNEAALTRTNSNSVLAANKQARTAYNNANGITESVTKGNA